MTLRREITATAGLALVGGVLLFVAEPALGLVVLAGSGAAGLLRPRPRRAVAVVVLLVAAGVLALAWARESPLLAAGGLAVLVAATVATLRSGRWPPPRRGAGPPDGREPTARDTWDALDRGEDPTV